MSPCIVRWLVQMVEKAEGIEKAALSDGHYHLDGVEISGAVETPSEIGVRIHGGVEFATERAKESEESVAMHGRDGE